MGPLRDATVHPHPVAVFDHDVKPSADEPPPEMAGAPPTTYCCFCCRSAVCCGRACTPPLKRRWVAFTVLVVAACLAGAGVGLAYGVFLKSSRGVRLTRVPGPAAPALSRRRLLALAPSSAVASSTSTAYAQACERGG